ncbi:MAG: DUF6375 family protein [Bryobacterales bacterium]|nr:DUF6375 family protein [Bryobacterales bacterium]
MKIWKSYGSGHSAQLTIVGEFANIGDATFAKEVVEDFVNAAWEERYPDVAAFLSAWKSRLGGIEYLGPNQFEFDMAIDNGCDVERSGTTVTISRIRSAQIGGIIKLMLLKDSTEIKVTGQTGP